MEYEEEYIPDEEVDLSRERLSQKEKRLISITRQKKRRQRLLRGLQQTKWFKPSIFVACEWCEETEDYEYNGRIKRGKHSRTQKWLKKTSERTVRHLPPGALPPKGNHYRKVFDYWNTWL